MRSGQIRRVKIKPDVSSGFSRLIGFRSSRNLFPVIQAWGEEKGKGIVLGLPSRPSGTAVWAEGGFQARRWTIR
jgi:hypothetical protein